jgi:hypothetical protein
MVAAPGFMSHAARTRNRWWRAGAGVGVVMVAATVTIFPGQKLTRRRGIQMDKPPPAVDIFPFSSKHNVHT